MIGAGEYGEVFLALQSAVVKDKAGTCVCHFRALVFRPFLGPVETLTLVHTERVWVRVRVRVWVWVWVCGGVFEHAGAFDFFKDFFDLTINDDHVFRLQARAPRYGCRGRSRWHPTNR